MFVKVTKSNGAEYIQIVSSYRENGQTRHKVLFNLGRRDVLTANPGIHRVIQRLAEITDNPSGSSGKHEGLRIDEEGAEVRHWGYVV
jgi:hypothetical protein